MKSKISNN